MHNCCGCDTTTGTHGQTHEWMHAEDGTDLLAVAGSEMTEESSKEEAHMLRHAALLQRGLQHL